MRIWKEAFLAVVLLNTLISSKSQTLDPVCGTSGGTEVGQRVTTQPPPDSAAGNDTVALLISRGEANCQGVVTAWEFYKRNTECDDVRFQVYREEKPNEYTLVGETVFSQNPCPLPGADGIVRITIPPEEWIPIQQGDVIGWRLVGLVGTGMIGLDNSGANRAAIRFGPCTKPPIGTCIITNNKTAEAHLVATVAQGNVPTFDNLPNSINLEEGNKNPGVVLYTVHSSVKRTWSIVVEPTLTTLSDLNTTGLIDRFSFDNSTGKLNTTVYNFNYETEPRQYNVTFTVHDGALSDTQTLTINILDVNQAHTINTIPALAISADQTPIGQVIHQVTLADPDVTNLSPKQFVILSQPVSGLFTIDETTGVVTCAKDFDTLASNPTATTWNPYDVVIQAADAVHRVNATMSITINNLRVRPHIVQLPYTTTVMETVVRGAEVYRLGVVVESRRRSLKFELLTITPPNGWNKFTLDPDTGAIKVPNGTDTSPVFDYSDPSQRQYNLTVRAVDDLYTGADQVLTVDIGWSNRPPEFPAPKYQEKTIEEEIKASDPPVMTLQATDRDTGFNSSGPDTLTYSILPSLASSYFTICALDKICISQRIDIDPPANKWMQNMTFGVSVTDASGASDTMDVRIFVTDINDNHPVFENVSFIANVKENNVGETPLEPPVTVSATDADSGWNAEIKYTLKDTGDVNMTKYFQVHPTDGHVTVKHPMDYESFNKKPMTFKFNVMATDREGDVSGKLAATPVTITVNLLDVNDNRPEFTQDFYNLEVRDNIMVGYSPATLTATDPDTVSRVSYFMLIPEPAFSLNADNGTVQVARPLREDHKYLLYCYARDNGEPELLSTPSIVRIDSFSHWKFLIDITLGIEAEDIVGTPYETQFFVELNKFLAPWIVKREGYREEKDSTIFTIYALHDNITDSVENIDQPKRFVWRDDLLGRLRKDIVGMPKDELKQDPGLKEFKVIRVMPRYPIWIIDTIPGIATLATLSFLALLLIIAIIVLLLRRFQLCCFKQKPVKVPVREPVVNRSYEEEFKLNYAKQPDDKKPLTPANNTTSLVETDKNNLRSRTTRRPPSAETIHSLIYVPHK